MRPRINSKWIQNRWCWGWLVVPCPTVMDNAVYVNQNLNVNIDMKALDVPTIAAFNAVAIVGDREVRESVRVNSWVFANRQFGAIPRHSGDSVLIDQVTKR